MDIKKLTQEVLLKNMTPEQQTAVLESVTASVKEAKAVQKQKIAENVDLVLQALKRIEGDMLKRVDGAAKTVEDRVKTIKDGKDGKNGIDGKAGKDGKDGKAGVDGRPGKDGINGVSGERGQDGVGVRDAHIDFDGSLIISLTDGQELNVGEVVPFDVAEKIKVISNGGGTSQFVLDTLASLQAEIDNLSDGLPSQTGNAGKFLTTDGTNASWASVAGGLSYQGTWNATTNTPTLVSSTGTNGNYYIVATAGSTNLDGITDWQIGDWLLFNGATWQKIDQSNLVTSVAGKTGAVTLVYADITGTVPTWNQNTTGNAATATNVAYSGLTGTVPTWNQDTTGNAATATLAATATNVAYSGLTGTIPTWNQNTTGTAANVTGTVAIVNGGTGATSAAAALTALGAYPASNPLGYTSNTGTVTSVAVSGGTTGLTTSGGPVTGSGTITLAGTLAVANGGTGATTASAARTNLGLVIGTNVLAPNGSAASLTSFPTLNQNTTGSAATVTGNATGSTFGFNSGYGSVATAYGCRAWVNFNGTGTVAIRASGNVSSITDNGTGDYTVNFTSALADANYGFALSCQGAGAGNILIGVEQHQGTAPTTTALRLIVKQGATALDRDDVCAAVFR